MIAAVVYGFHFIGGVLPAVPFAYLAWVADRVPATLYVIVYPLSLLGTVTAALLAVSSAQGGAAFTVYIGPAEMLLVRSRAQPGGSGRAAWLSLRRRKGYPKG